MLENSVVQGFFRARAAGVNLDLADALHIEKIKRKGVKDAELSASNSEMKRKKSIISFLALFVMALAMIFTGDRTVQAAQVSSITSGDEYVIVSNGYALTASGNSLTGTRYTDGQTEITDSMKWTVTQSGEGYTIRSVANDRYVWYNRGNVSLSSSSYS